MVGAEESREVKIKVATELKPLKLSRGRTLILPAGTIILLPKTSAAGGKPTRLDHDMRMELPARTIILTPWSNPYVYLVTTRRG